MTTLAAKPAPRPLAKEDYAAATLWAGVALMLVLAIPTLGAHLADERMLIGVSVWDKPLKFELSIAIHLATLAVVTSLFTAQARASRLVRTVALVNAFAGVAEIAYILIQAARGRASHFNFDTPLEIFMYGAMGTGAVSMVLGSLVLGIAASTRLRAEVGGGLKTGVVLGLVLGSAFTLVIAGLMSSSALTEPGHWVSGDRTDATGLPFFGWSTTGGDLRVPHFFATHLMQALPLLGLIADRAVPKLATLLVWLGAALGLAIVGGTFAQALMGLPLLRM